jgi:phospholipid N-methyltransferase
VIQHNLLKTKELLNQSVTKVRQLNSLRAARNQINKAQTPAWLLFAREILRNPRTMGAGLPSTPRLAKAMANFVPKTENELVVELGAGTGIVTQALLQRGIPPERLIAIEQAHTLTEYLHQRYPQARIINGDALHLCQLLGNDCQQVTTIVSSLPFRSLPHSVGHGIIEQIQKVLPKNGLLIQFTYDISGRTLFLPSDFKRVSHKIVWRNLPPARVDVYKHL